MLKLDANGNEVYDKASPDLGEYYGFLGNAHALEIVDPYILIGTTLVAVSSPYDRGILYIYPLDGSEVLCETFTPVSLSYESIGVNYLDETSAVTSYSLSITSSSASLSDVSVEVLNYCSK